ncbi:MAG: hypothetical protein Q8S84_02720 [bacterium]|nr:hypothetical protein [bacterium]MDP3380452.1 hypothetical protein [bacterium]
MFNVYQLFVFEHKISCISVLNFPSNHHVHLSFSPSLFIGNITAYQSFSYLSIISDTKLSLNSLESELYIFLYSELEINEIHQFLSKIGKYMYGLSSLYFHSEVANNQLHFLKNQISSSSQSKSSSFSNLNS